MKLSDDSSMKSKRPVVLVTGAVAGIGRAVVLAFARAGYVIGLSDIKSANSESLLKEIKDLGSEGIFILADHSKESDNQRVVDEVMQKWGRLDAAVNNAGTEGQPGLLIENQTAENFKNTFSLNVEGVLWGMKFQIPALQKSGGGAIVNLSSVAGHVGIAGMAAYVASKHAVEGLTKVAALENAQKNIRVNAVAPGAIQTDMIDRFVGKGDSAERKDLIAEHPIGRIGRAEEVAAAIIFLCSNSASFITGQSLPIDGGWTVA
jgi:NAD(P)-dependent dehydrogenase (short-subunit alcohol dehydrogenase family)